MATGPMVNNTTSLALDPDPKPSARRRQVIVSEKKSTVEVAANGGNPGINNDKIVINGNDLSHTLRGETVLGRPRDLSHARRGLTGASTMSPRRRKSSSKPEKSRWLTVVSILTKNCILLMVLFIVGRMIWKWSDKLSESTHMPFAALDFEGRISDVESSLKKTAKMMQVQLEVVDRKIGTETGNVRWELSNKIEENSGFFEKELKKLDARSDSLEKSLAELKDSSFFSKEDLEKLLSDFRKSQDLERNGRHFTLDEIRTYARDVVVKEIEKHAADGLGRVDYALASSGARVVRHSEPYDLGKVIWFPVGKGRNRVHANAHKMLQPSFGEPGQCFPLNGNSGFVEIKLRTGIVLDSITLEHVAKSVAYDRSSAPKECRVSAWFEGPEDNPSTRSEKSTLVEFTYNLERSNAQTFDVVEPGQWGVINMVRLDFTSNHGCPSHTCIYRLRVHGHEPNSETTRQS
uniref:SUN domain-containing protein 2 n=1 Tax=Anthurium amnicola TaxID=1678845 RepID=A0A1D1YDD8_9ARAE